MPNTIRKTLRVKKDDVCDDFSNKVLIFKTEITDGQITKVDGILEVDMTDGSRGKIKLDWEIAMYREKFWREFDELILTSKRQLTRRCVFI